MINFFPSLYNGNVLRLILAAWFLSVGYGQTTLDDSPAAVEAGLRVFRSKCSRCHDLNGQGYKGRDLSQLSSRNITNAQLANIIARGVGTEMPPFKLTPPETQHVIAYLRSLGGPAVVDRGDPRRGEALFWGKLQCGNCHMIAGRGGRLGPNLTLIGASRSKSFLIREVRNPHDYVPRGFDTITVVTLSGEKVTGVIKNEDVFSIQMMDAQENLRLFLKDELREITRAKESLMPIYGPDRLTETEMDDLLRYLASLR